MEVGKVLGTMAESIPTLEQLELENEIYYIIVQYESFTDLEAP